MLQTSLILSLLVTFPSVLAGYGDSTIKWGPCTEAPLSSIDEIPFECAKLPVPLDYIDQDNSTKLDLALTKVKATKEPFMGTIIMNPGGPANTGSSFFAADAAMTGGHHDILTFDPRGTGKTLQINCYGNDSFSRLRSDTMAPSTTNASDTALGTHWAIQKMLAQRCYDTAGGNATLIGTAFTARDMIQIVDALGGDGMLRYWGQSYGTVLGATVAAMFPDRIERIVLDGIANIHEYTDGWYVICPFILNVLELIKSTSKRASMLGKDACVLADGGVTAQNLSDRTYDLIQTVKFEPIVLDSNISADIITIRDVVEGGFNEPFRTLIDYAIPLAEYLNAIFTRNATGYRFWKAQVNPLSAVGPIPLNFDNTQAIRCGDSTYRADNLDEVRPRVDKLLKSSRLFGDIYTPGYLGCSQWKMEAKVRYDGDFHAKTKYPALLIGSPYDMRTPLVNAQNLSASLEGSVVLQHNGHGHCVLYSPGQCAIKAVQDYFTNGTLPEPGTVCEQEFDIFSGKTRQDSFVSGAESD
ncbi:alpha/beta-hydrolase [Lentithecium fluviatile CBS 122367]|uniref:Alpha/beta-hydrolase n=1 Tax=Lentithecium fluviatile CBS 122367 TaxID=1168545 RepID=A0A6G1IES6_9PLEO|nr:alpha/beta-hydrolase [Lentithecium fluviatile CBS 122367]